jgi:hypothetical protein
MTTTTISQMPPVRSQAIAAAPGPGPAPSPAATPEPRAVVPTSLVPPPSAPRHTTGGASGSRGTTSTSRAAPPRLPQSVSQAVQLAIRGVEDHALQRVARADAGPAFEPRMLLVIMTYCYAKEIFSSADIEEFLRMDQRYRNLFRNEYPDARVFRRFRRENRQVLQSCLARTLRFVLSAALPPEAEAPGETQISLEAAHRMTKATFIDSMEVHD